MVDRAAIYRSSNLFPAGTVHHAAEIGSVHAIQQVEQKEKQLRGLPADVVLQQRDELLQCVPLHVAAEQGHLEVVQYIAQHDVDLDAADGYDVRPLHLAAINNHCDVVNALVDKGANVTKQDSEGDLPTHWAATKGHEQMLEMLLNRGAPVDAHNKAGWTALHRAAFNGRVEACRLLMRRGASIHAVTKAGSTALHLAASNNHLGVMELLLQLGASTHMKDQHGATPLEVCIGDAARGLIEEKRSGARDASAQARSRPMSRSTPEPDKAGPAPDITRVPHMPRFKPAANDNLDADGFPTVEAQLASSGAGLLAQEPSAPDDEGPGASEVLLLEAEQAQAAEWARASGSLAGASQSSYVMASSSSFSPMPGQLSQQSSRQQHPALSASASFDRGSGSPSKQQKPSPQAWLSGKQQKQGGGMQRFLKQYSLDRKGLFAP